MRPKWWRRWGSNPLPLACHASALPTELRPHRGSHVTSRPVRSDHAPVTGGAETRQLLSARVTARADDIPTHRYTAALAGEIERTWQDRWDAEHVFWTPNRTGLLAEDPRGLASRPSRYVLDMFPYPSGVGLHVGHPLGFIATDVYARFCRMDGFNVLHAMGYDAFGLPAEQYAVQTGTHPRVTTEANIANMRRQIARARSRARLAARPLYHRCRLLPVDAVDLPADLQLLVRRRSGSGSSGDGARRRVRGRDARDRRRTRVQRAHVNGTARARRLVPPRVHRRGSGQLVSRSGHRARQRRGHRRRAQRARQLPGVQAAAQAVDDADHRVRRSVALRSRRARLVRLDQAHAAQLDRPVDRRVWFVSR